MFVCIAFLRFWIPPIFLKGTLIWSNDSQNKLYTSDICLFVTFPRNTGYICKYDHIPDSCLPRKFHWKSEPHQQCLILALRCNWIHCKYAETTKGVCRLQKHTDFATWRTNYWNSEFTFFPASDDSIVRVIIIEQTSENVVFIPKFSEGWNIERTWLLNELYILVVSCLHNM